MGYDKAEQARYAQRHYQANREAYLSRQRAAAAQNRHIIRIAKDRPCADCGIKYPPHVMQFDHLDGVQKRFVISDIGARSIENLRAEIAKCEVVCANCHAERTWQRAQQRPRKPEDPDELTLFLVAEAGLEPATCDL